LVGVGKRITERLDFILKWIYHLTNMFFISDDIQTDLLLKLQIKNNS
jgi:hypothetical protein